MTPQTHRGYVVTLLEPDVLNENPAAKYWHDLYQAKCQELHDEKARLGAQIEALEENSQTHEPAQPKGLFIDLIAQHEGLKEELSLIDAQFAYNKVMQGSEPDLMDALRAAIAAYKPTPAVQQDSEPVAEYIGETPYGSHVQLFDDIKKGTKLFTTPQPQIPKWQPIETAPKDVSILVFHPDGGVCESANIQGKTRRIWVCLDGTRGRSTYFESEPTHWMPLPAAPTTHDTTC